jgi:putative oxidoreductase
MSDLPILVAWLRWRAQPKINLLADLGPLIMRLTVGTVFIASGFGKLAELDKVTDFFTELGIFAPRLNAIVVACTECFGGVALTIGLAARLAALPLAITMVVAISTALLPDVSSALELVSLSEFAYLVMFLNLALTGPGRFSIDHWLTQRLFMRGADDGGSAIAAGAAQ